MNTTHNNINVPDRARPGKLQVEREKVTIGYNNNNNNNFNKIKKIV